MRRYLLFLFVLFLVSASCNCAAAPIKPLDSPFVNEITAHYYKSTVRILGYCPSGMFAGTGFVAGPKTIITAKHIAYCKGNVNTPALLLIVRTWDGRTFMGVPDQYGKLDTATLKLTTIIEGLENGKMKSVEGEFKLDWARQTRRHPKIGELLCYVGGSIAIDVIKVKCSTVFFIMKNGAGFWIGTDGKGGNSGGPVFDEYGLVIGIATMTAKYGEDGLMVLYSEHLPYVTIEIEDAGITDSDPSVVE